MTTPPSTPRRTPMRAAQIAALWLIIPSVLLGLAFAALIYVTQGPFSDVDAAMLAAFYGRWAIFGVVLWIIAGLGGIIGVAALVRPDGTLTARGAFAWGAGGIVAVLGGLLLLTGSMSASLAAPLGMLVLVIAASGYALVRGEKR